MLICAFPGCGKSFLTSQYPEVFEDLDSGLFNKRSDGTTNPRFIDDYIDAISKELENTNKHLLVSTHHEIVKFAREQAHEAVVIVPDPSLCEEYMMRYRRRKSPDDFIKKIYDNWENYIVPLTKMDNVIVLKSGEYLSDVFEFGDDFNPLTVKLRRLNNG